MHIQNPNRNLSTRLTESAHQTPPTLQTRASNLLPGRRQSGKVQCSLLGHFLWVHLLYSCHRSVSLGSKHSCYSTISFGLPVLADHEAIGIRNYQAHTCPALPWPILRWHTLNHRESWVAPPLANQLATSRHDYYPPLKTGQSKHGTGYPEVEFDIGMGEPAGLHCK